jgi:uncharacterized ferredoxin-like protein
MLSRDTQHAFPGYGQMKPEQQEIDRLRKEAAKLRAERDILIMGGVALSVPIATCGGCGFDSRATAD